MAPAARDKPPAGTAKHDDPELGDVAKRVEQLSARVQQLETRLGTPPSSPPPPDANVSFAEPGPPDPGRPDLQRFLGELHGVLDAVIGLERLAPEDRRSLEAAYREVSVEFGRTQARLNSGVHDRDLLAAGLGGAQFVHKLRRWADGVKAFVADNTPAGALRALRAGRVVVGTAATVVGVSEPIKEFTESVAEVLTERE